MMQNFATVVFFCSEPIVNPNRLIDLVENINNLFAHVFITKNCIQKPILCTK